MGDSHIAVGEADDRLILN